MTPAAWAAVVGAGMTCLMNFIALVIFIVKLSERLRFLGLATEKLSASVDKMDSRVDGHETRIAIMEALNGIPKK